MRGVGVRRNAWIGVCVLAACLLPAWAVESASRQSRMIWIGAVAFLGFLGLIGALADMASGRTQNAPIPRLRHQRYVGLVVGISFLSAQFCAIMFTHLDEGPDLIRNLGYLLSAAGSGLFPVIGRYAEDLSLSPQALLRAQSIVSAFLLAGFLSAAALVFSLFRTPDIERRLFWERNRPNPPPPALIVVSLPFVILIALSAYFGWGEFDGQSADRCFIKAACYTHGDDLTLMTAALAKTFAVFGFPLGALVLLDTLRLRSDRH
jgi:uncharacterized membrane protein